MDFLKVLLDDKGSELVRGLVENAGFATSEAEGFVPKAVSAAIEAIQGGGVDLSSLLSSGGISSLISQLDLGKLASSTGVGKDKASAGLQSLLPTVLEALQGKAGGAGAILSMLGGASESGASGGGALGGIGKLAGSFFKK